VLEKLKQVDRGLAGLERLAVMAVVLLVLVTQTLDVALRELGHGGLNGASELARWMVLAMAFIGASLATSERRHITIDLLDRSISPRVKACFNLVVQGLGVLVVLYLAHGAWELLLDKKMQRLGVGLEVPGFVPRGLIEGDFWALPLGADGELPAVPKMPLWMFLLVAPVSLLLIAWRLTLLCLEDLFGLRSGNFDYLEVKTEEGRLY